MAVEENKALARRVLEGMFNKGNLDVADELLAPNYVDHDPAMPEDIHGPEGFKHYVGAYRSAFSDLHLQIEDQVAEGDKVVTARFIVVDPCDDTRRARRSPGRLGR